MKTKLTVVLLIWIALSGCVKETLDPCPSGNVRIKVYAEKFQTNSSEAGKDCEESFSTRIKFLHCILYKGSSYVMDTTVSDVSAVSGPYLDFGIPNLDFGNYQLVVIGNCSPDAMRGDIHVPGGLSLLYTGVDATEDLFAASLDFTVDCNCTQEFETKLRRLLGVIRCHITHVPDNIDEAEVTIHGVNSELGKGGLYSHNIDITRRMSIPSLTRAANGLTVVLGAFPTITNKPASYELKLFASGQTDPVYSQVLTQEVNVVRNQLVELYTDFADGNVHFEIRVNSRWDDFIPGGDVEAP